MKVSLKIFFVGLLIYVLICSFLITIFAIPEIHGLYEITETFLHFQLFNSTATPSDEIVIIDEGDSVYDREEYAKIIDYLGSVGAHVIALDVLFFDKKECVDDFLLIENIKRRKEKIILGVEFTDRVNSPSSLPDFHIETAMEKLPDYTLAYGVLLPYSGLLQNARDFAHINRTIDISRREAQYYPLVINYNNRVYPSMALLAAAKQLNGKILIEQETATDFIAILSLDGSTLRRIPINVHGQVTINFIEEHKFGPKIIPFGQVLHQYEKRAQDSKFKDNIILIGSSHNSQDQCFGPHSKSYSGLIILATIISQILNEQFIRESSLAGIFASGILSIIMIFIMFKTLDVVKLKYPQRNTCHLLWLYIACFPLFCILAKIFLQFGLRMPIVLPYTLFALTTPLTKWYFDRQRTLIFVSYSSQNDEFAKKLALSLEKYNIKLWLFQSSLKPGDKWREVAHTAILNSSAFLIILSPDALKSRYIEFERLTAKMYNKPILPVLYETCTIPEDLQGIEYSDFRNMANFKSNIEECAKVLKCRKK